MNKVVKCTKCGQYFMLTEQDTKCRFCKTESVEIVEIVEKENKEPKKKKETAKAGKKSFKIWGNS